MGRTLFTLAALVAAAALPAGAGRQDSELAQLVEEQLQGWGTFSGSDIDVEVQDGRAALTGSVSRLDQSWKAAELASRVRGVVAVDNQLRVVGPVRDDRWILNRVREAFGLDLKLLGSGIEPGVENGRVVLRGTTERPALRFAARLLAAQVEGVLDVLDEVQSPEEPDELIAQRARALLSPAVPDPIAGRVLVAVSGGEVTLSGTVRILRERDRAAQIALGLRGVRAVVNRIEVQPRTDDVGISSPAGDADVIRP
ncbi:MAG: BON domain-containing protein [Acidobacteria bacterium]|nr:BON domain-containing protein [Acidobacteriota bacterium]